nr:MULTISPECIES: prepilin-type N-terminal cleavage/methylation domain-containing protein [unclassified Francisella]
MHNKEKIGFSVVELMVVIAIIVIIAGVTIPMYSEYITKTQMVDTIHANGGDRSEIADYYHANGSFGSKDEFDSSEFAQSFNSTVAGEHAQSKTITWLSANAVRVDYVNK